MGQVNNKKSSSSIFGKGSDTSRVIGTMDSTYPLEHRILLDGAALETIGEAFSDEYSSQSSHADLLAPGPGSDPTSMEAILASIQQYSSEEQQKHIIIVDSAVDKDQTLASGLSDNVEIYYLNPEQDVWSQINTILDTRQGLAGLHVITHGGPGSLSLGREVVDFSVLGDKQSRNIATWGQVLDSSGDIFIYGCNFGAGEKGRQAVEILASLTDADVAASDDVTGVSGDWELETKVGVVSEASVFSEKARDNFREDLADSFNGALSEPEIDNYFDGATDNNPALLFREGNNGYGATRADPSLQTRDGQRFAPDFSNSVIRIAQDTSSDRDSNAFVLLTKDYYDLETESVVFTFRFSSTEGQKVAGVFGLVDPNANFDNTPFGSAGEKEIGMMGNYNNPYQLALDGSRQTADDVRNRHLFSWATFRTEAWDRSAGQVAYNYHALLPPTNGPLTPRNSVVIGAGEDSYDNRFKSSYKDQELSALPESYYSSAGYMEKYMRVKVFKYNDNYYIRISTANWQANGAAPRDSDFTDVNANYSDASKPPGTSGADNIDLYNGEPGIRLGNNARYFKSFFAMGSSIDGDHRLTFLTVDVEPANYSPQYDGSAVAIQGKVDSTGTAPVASTEGVRVRDFLSGKVRDGNNPTDDIGLAIIGLGADYDSTKHKIYVYREVNGAYGWGQITASDFQNNAVLLLKPTDRIQIISTDANAASNTTALDILDTYLWDGFKYSAGTHDIDVANEPVQNSPFSTASKEIQVRFSASGDDARIVETRYVALFDENDPSDDVTLTNTIIGINDLATSSQSEYKYAYVIVLSQAVSMNSLAASNAFTLDGASQGVSASLMAQQGKSATWTIVVTAEHDVDDNITIKLNDAAVFLTDGGQNLENTILPDSTRSIDLDPPEVRLATNSVDLTENEQFTPISITNLGTENLVHRVVSVTGNMVDATKIPTDMFLIQFDSLAVSGTLDYERIFLPSQSSLPQPATITIRSTDDAGNYVDSEFVLSLTNVDENVAPEQTGVKVIVMTEDASGGQAIEFKDLNLRDTDENGSVFTVPQAFADTNFLLITSAPSGGRIVRYVNGAVTEEYSVNQYLSRDDIENGYIRYIPNQNYFTLPLQYDVLKFRAADSLGLRSQDLEVHFTVRPVNDVPDTSGSTQIDVQKGDSHTLEVDDLGSLYFDVEDGTVPSKIVIVSISDLTAADGGKLINENGADVLIDTDIDDVTKITYSSDGTSVGGLVVVFYGIDSDGAFDKSSTGTITFNLTEDKTAPSVQDVAISAIEDTEYSGLPANAGDYGYADAENDAMVSIRILSLPLDKNTGKPVATLMQGAQTISVGDEITLGELSNVRITFEQDYTGRIEITYQAVNDRGSSSNVRHIIIDVADADDPITTSDSTITVTEDVNYTFQTNDFIYSDPDDPSGSNMKVAFQAIPQISEGRIVIVKPSATAGGGSTVDVGIGDTIDYNEINSGRLLFIPAPDVNDDITLRIILSNDGNLVTQPHDFKIEITPVDDVPESQDKTIQLIEDHGVVGTTPGYAFVVNASDYGDAMTNDFVFMDPDVGDVFASVVLDELPDAAVGKLILNGTPIDQVTDIDVSQLTRLKFLLNPNADMSTSLVFRVENSQGEVSSNKYTISFDVQAVDDVPIISNMPTIAIDQKGTATYGSPSGFTLSYSDPDGEVITSIILDEVEIPGVGSFYLGSAQILAPATINVGDLSRIEFRPDPTYAGSYTTKVKVSSGTLESTAADLIINIGNVEDPPEGKDVVRTIDEDRDYTFTVNLATTTALDSDFYYYDADQGSQFGGIRIDSLPDAQIGVLTINNIAVSLGQAIDAADINNLVFTPNNNVFGTLSFEFSVFTEAGNVDQYSASRYNFTISILPIDDRPTGGDVTVTVEEDTAIIYQGGGGNSAFNFPYTDIEGDELHSIVLTNPLNSQNNGKFLVGTRLLTSSVILRSDLESGSFSFVPNPNYNGTFTLTYSLASEDPLDASKIGASSATTNKLIFVVGPVDDAPLTNDRSVTIQEDTSYFFKFNASNPADKSSNNDFYFFDAEQESFFGVEILSAPSTLGELFVGSRKVNSGDILQELDLRSFSFVPAQNMTGLAEFTFRVLDNETIPGNQESAGATFRIEIAAIDDKPTLGSQGQREVRIATTEKSTATYGDGDFFFPYYDPEDVPGVVDDNDFSAVVFNAVIPKSVGSFYHNGTLITGNLIASQLDAGLVFVPHDTFAGDRSFTFRLMNAGGQLSDSDYTLIIAVGDIDYKPESSHVTQTIREDSTYTFKTNLGTESDLNPDTNDFAFIKPGNDQEDFEGVRIISLPTRGSLMLGTSLVTAGQDIQRNQISSLSFIPFNDFNGQATFQFQVYDDGDNLNGSKYSKAHNYVIVVESVDDKPVFVTPSLTFSMLENAVIRYAADFSFIYSDADNDQWTSVSIETLQTAAGQFLLNSQSISTNIIAVNDLSNLSFQAGTGRHTNASFNIYLVNANGQSAAEPFVVNIGEIDRPPTAADITLTTTEPTAAGSSDYNFGGSFLSQLANVYLDEESVPLNRIVINRVIDPRVGVLYVDSTQVIDGTTIDIGQLPNLRLIYLPSYESGKSGVQTERVVFQVVNTQNPRIENGITLDSDQRSTDSYTLYIEISNTDDLPSSSDITVTANEDEELRYGQNGFRFQYIDPDDPAANNLTVSFTNIPGVDQGSFYLTMPDGSRNDINVGSRVSAVDLSRLRFSGAQDFHGDVTFSFVVSNLNQISTLTYSGEIEIQDVADRPRSSDNMVGIDEGGSHTFSYSVITPSTPRATDLTDFVYIDPDREMLSGILISDISHLSGLGTFMVNGTALTSSNLFVSKDDLEAGNFSFVADRYNEENVTFSFIVVADRASLSNSNEHEFVININALPNKPSVTAGSFTIDEDQALNILASDFTIVEPDVTDTVTVFVFTGAPLSNQGSLVYGTLTIGSGERVTLGAGGNFPEALSFIPSPNFNSAQTGSSPVEIEYYIETGDGTTNEISTTETLHIDVQAVDDPIGARNITVSIKEGQTATFGRDTFLAENNQPNDPDEGEELDQVRFVGVPSDLIGSFILDAQAAGTSASGMQPMTITNGQSVSVTDLDQLRFVPVEDYDQSITATYDVIGSAGEISANQYLIVIDIELQQDNPTVSGSPSILVDAGLSHVIPADEFTSIFDDVDSGDSMKGIIVVGVPSAAVGELHLDQDTVTSGQTILVDELVSLTFVPIGVDPMIDPVAGSGSFRFSLLDQDDNQSPVTTFTVDVLTDPNLPTTSGRNLYLPSNLTYTFSEFHFPYDDADGDVYESVQFLNNPLRGVFYLDLPIIGSDPAKLVMVSAGMRVAASDLNYLRYHLDDGTGDYSDGSVELIFRVVNDRNATSSSETITVNITDSTNLAPVPIHSPGEHLPGVPFVRVDRGFSYKLRDELTNLFTDPEGDHLSIVSVDGLQGTGLTYKPRTGVISGAPTLVNAGRYSVTITVQDTFGNAVEQKIDLIVANLLLTLPGNDLNTFQSTLQQIYDLDTEDSLPQNFADALVLSKSENPPGSVDFFREGVSVSGTAQEQLAALQEFTISDLTVQIAFGHDFALLHLILDNKDRGIRSQPFTLAIKLDELSGLKKISPTAERSYTDVAYTASGVQPGFRANDESMSQSSPSRSYINRGVGTSGQENFHGQRNSAGYDSGSESESSAYGVAIPSSLRSSLREVSPSGNSQLGNVHSVRNQGTSSEVYSANALQRSKVQAANPFDGMNQRLQQLSLHGKEFGNQDNILKVVDSGMAAGDVPGSGARSRQEFFARTENAFFSKRPIDRVVTAALQRQAGDLYTSPLPDADQAGANIWSLIRSGDLPTGAAARGLVPSLYGQRGATPTAPANNPQVLREQPLDRATLDDQEEEDDALQREELALLQEADDQNIQLPSSEELDRVPTDQREEFLQRLIGIIRNQGGGDPGDGAETVGDANTASQADQERIRELELLNRLIRGR